MKYEWDETKNQINLTKHGLHFAQAPLVFEYFHITKVDNRQSYGEKRFLTMGSLGLCGRLVIIAHTQRKDRIRIISMRKANSREQSIFQQALEQLDD